MSIEDIKRDILKSEIKSRLEIFERDVTIISGILVLTPLMIILISSIFYTSIIYITVPILIPISLIFIHVITGELDSIFRTLIDYRANIVEKYRKFKNEFFKIFKSLDEKERIIMKYVLCNKLSGSDMNVEPYNTIFDMSTSPYRSRDSIDVSTLENFRRFIVKEVERFLFRVSTLLILCMFCEGILVPILYEVLISSLRISSSIGMLVMTIIVVLLIYFYTGYKMFNVVRMKLGFEKNVNDIIKRLVITFLVCLIFCTMFLIVS